MNNFKPDEIGNYAIGDMTLNKEQLEHFLGVKKVGRSGFKDPTKKWANGLVIYKFSDEITEDKKGKIKAAFKIVNAEFEGWRRDFCDHHYSLQDTRQWEW